MEVVVFGEKVKGFIASPIEMFKKVKEEPFGASFRYFIILAVLYALLNAIVGTILWHTWWGFMFSAYEKIPGFGVLFQSEVTTALSLFVLFFLFLLGGIFLGGGIIHLGVLMFGGKRGYIETVKAVLYADTPSLLLGWIPIVGIFIGLWSFILEFFGIKELQDMSIGRAIAAVLIPMIIIGVIASIVIAAIVFFYVMSSMGSHGI